MKWRFQNNGSVIVDQNENIVCVFQDNSDSDYRAIIKYAPEMFEAIMDF